MPHPPVDPRWPRLLSLAVHEFRTPMTVVAGYIRMLLKDRAGPLSDAQRKLLEEAEKSTGRLSALLAEMSDLSALEGGTATINRMPVDVRGILTEAISALPILPDRQIDVDLTVEQEPVMVTGDPVRLRTAFGAVLAALRRELVTATRLHVHESAREADGRPVAWIVVSDPDHVGALVAADAGALTTFDEWRGGCGLSLGVARRVIEAHGGDIRSGAADVKTGTVIALPRA
jgi:signal transduction histidine kinase